MQLVSVTVTKYRSIKKAHKLRLSRLSVLVGPNNEGKSNLLRALVTAMQVLTRARFEQPIPAGHGAVRVAARVQHSWERDFPLDLQRAQPQGASEITLEFELTPEETQEFKKAVKSDLNGTLPIRISLPANGHPKVDVVKKGPGGKALTAKSRAIAEFVSRRLSFEHIPAVRTASSAQEIVREMVGRELATLEDAREYQDALNAIAKLQEPILQRLSRNIRETLVQFLPDVTAVKVEVSEEDRYRALRGCQITVNDGTATLLQHKGDGVQSLAALGIMRHASESISIGRNLVIAIEEPESHLHPGAIHELRQVLHELSGKHQVVITTHNPLFVDRTDLGNNILVKDSRARPAKTIEELRSILGVKAADNLRHAEVVLLVEGGSDEKALRSLLRLRPRCRTALDSGALAIDTLDGAGNLGYKASLVRNALCLVHCFLDNDDAGRRAFESARIEGLLSDGDVNWSTCDGKKNSELEDLIEPALYSAMLENSFGVSLRAPNFKSSEKWTERMKKTFVRQGKRWDERIERDVKNRIAEIVSAAPERACIDEHRTVFDALARALEARLTQVSTRSRTN